MIFRPTAGVFLGFIAYSLGRALPANQDIFSNSMAVLDLVELGGNQTVSEPSENLRQNLVEHGGFKIVPKAEMVKKLAEFGVPANQTCNNPQCSFDAGGYLQAGFVLYGTYSPIENMRYAVTLKLLYVPEGRIAWNWVGEVSGAVPGGVSAWTGVVDGLVRSAKKEKLLLQPAGQRRSLALIDVSENAYPARVFSEQVITHVNGLVRYQPISASELSELLSALGINKYSMPPSPQNMIGLGERLDVSGVIYVRVSREGGNYSSRLAMYDIQKKAAVLEFPPKPSPGFDKVLEYEQAFFSELEGKERERAKEDARHPVVSTLKSASSGGRTNLPLWISLGVLCVGGGLMILWVEGLKK